MAISAPQLNIPHSDQTCKVSIIDTTCRVKVPVPIMLMPQVLGHDVLYCPAFSFLVENVTLNRRVLFDLGVRKDWENAAPSVMAMVDVAVSHCITYKLRFLNAEIIRVLD